MLPILICLLPQSEFFLEIRFVEKPHLLWVYICRFNISIPVGLFSALFVKLLGERHRYLAAGRSQIFFQREGARNTGRGVDRAQTIRAGPAW